MVDENTVGREPITIVEIDQDFCQETYGNAPCAAAIGVTGSYKCYNTKSTCQNVPNYNRGSLTLRFCSKTSAFPIGESEQYIPMVEKVSTNPMEINVSAGDRNVSPLGRRATITINMQDAPYNDQFVDKYLSTRGFDPLQQSTFWAKFLARNEFYQNRPLRVRYGYIGQSVATMETRHYFLDKISGPDSRGRVTIKAVDVLSFADDRKRKAPVASSGVLNAGISNSDGSATLSPVGIGNAEYPASGKVIIGKEVIAFTRSGDTLTLTARGENNTDPESHSTSASVQLCLEYTNATVVSVIEDLLENYGGIDSSYIDTAAWQAEAAPYLTNNVTALIVKPTGVSKLVGELLEQFFTSIWWDATTQKVNLKVTQPIPSAAVLNVTQENNIIADSFKYLPKPEWRINSVTLRYNLIDVTAAENDAVNYENQTILINTQRQSVDEYNDVVNRVVNSRWMNASAPTIAFTSNLMLAYSLNPTLIEFDLDAKDRSIGIMDVVRVTHRSLVDSQGSLLDTIYQVISKNEVIPGHRIRYKCQSFGLVGRFAYIMVNNAPDFTSATQSEKDRGAWVCLPSGFMSDGSDGYKII